MLQLTFDRGVARVDVQRTTGSLYRYHSNPTSNLAPKPETDAGTDVRYHPSVGSDTHSANSKYGNKRSHVTKRISWLKIHSALSIPWYLCPKCVIRCARACTESDGTPVAG
ncbi:hypothetical protein EVAR_94676_1 [Eumeta japonica]|uniref:Uncharacterized protein n=1 Tax=Eumeta variegata TaxID=151549 RepID=A0A4C1UWV9_EUMVA|nr:hypothetical protein EVAR_94676_1 [Eumeta japonica]